jgi:signal peptidase I
MSVWLQLLGWTGALAAAILLLLWAVAFDLWRIPTDDPLLAASIQPTLSAGDLLLVTRRTTPSRGDLLRCADPQAPGRFVIGRAMAQAGDHLVLQGGVVIVDGHHAPSPHACDEPKISVFDPNRNDDVELDCAVEASGEMTYSVLRSRDATEPATKLTIERNKWFLVSDNRSVHLDSRDFGEIGADGCQHIVFRLAGPAGLSDATSRFTVIW